MTATSPSAGRTPIRTAAAWRPADIADPAEWTVVLSDAERAEIVAAVGAARAYGATVTTVDVASFPLPTLSGRMEEWELVRGDVEHEHDRSGSGVNNAVARTASLAALAVITDAYRIALTVAAGCAPPARQG